MLLLQQEDAVSWEEGGKVRVYYEIIQRQIFENLMEILRKKVATNWYVFCLWLPDICIRIEI